MQKKNKNNFSRRNQFLDKEKANQISITEEEKQQLQILEKEFISKKKRKEEKGIIPRIEDFIVIEDNNNKIPITKSDLEMKKNKIAEQILYIIKFNNNSSINNESRIINKKKFIGMSILPNNHQKI